MGKHLPRIRLAIASCQLPWVLALLSKALCKADWTSNQRWQVFPAVLSYWRPGRETVRQTPGNPSLRKRTGATWGKGDPKTWRPQVYQNTWLQILELEIPLFTQLLRHKLNCTAFLRVLLAHPPKKIQRKKKLIPSSATYLFSLTFTNQPVRVKTKILYIRSYHLAIHQTHIEGIYSFQTLFRPGTPARVPLLRGKPCFSLHASKFRPFSFHHSPYFVQKRPANESALSLSKLTFRI